MKAIFVDRDGTKQELTDEQLAFLGADPSEEVRKFWAASPIKTKQTKVWLTACIVTDLLQKVVEKTPNAAEFRSVVLTFVPDAIFKDVTLGNVCKEVRDMVVKKTGSFYTHDGVKIAAGGSVAKQDRTTLMAKFATLATQEREAYYATIVEPMCLHFAELYKVKVKKGELRKAYDSLN